MNSSTLLLLPHSEHERDFGKAVEMRQAISTPSYFMYSTYRVAIAAAAIAAAVAAPLFSSPTALGRPLPRPNVGN